jgi:hypothetical protein
LWSVWMRCPMPWVFGVGPFRAFRQLGYAIRRGWVLREPVWWWQALVGLMRCARSRRAVPWRKYRAWMQLVREPHGDAGKWEREFGGEP